MTIIKTKDFILRPIKLEDAPAFLECYQDKETKRGFLSEINDISSARKSIREKINQSKLKKPKGETFVIEINGKFAGFIEIHNLNEKYFEFKGTIGYCTHPNFRGRGITTKTVKIITEYAFNKYKLKRIEGWCRTFNKASARVLEKAGYKLEGILRKNKFKNGKYLDDMVWAKVK